MMPRIKLASAAVIAILMAGCGGPRAIRTPLTADATMLQSQDATLAGALAELQRHPTGAAHRKVGLEFLRLNVFDQANDHLTEAIKKDKRDAVAFDARARIWREWNQPRRAIEDATRAVQLAPRSAEFHNTLGTVIFAMGVPSDAEQEFLKAMELDPSAGYAANNLCYLAFVAGRTERAANYCNRALALTPDLTAAHRNLALVYAGTDLPRAKQELLADGDEAVAGYNLGILYLARGEYAQAVDAFGPACDRRPPIRDACERIVQTRRLTKAK